MIGYFRSDRLLGWVFPAAMRGSNTSHTTVAEEDTAEGGAPRKEAFKVALISNAAYSVINFRLPLIAELVHRGCTVDVLAPTWSQQERQKVESLGAHCLCYPLERKSLNPLGHLRTFLKLVGIFRTNRYDALLSYTAQANVWGTLAAAWAGVPRRVAMVEGLGYAFTADPEGRSPFKRRVLSWVLTQLYRLAFPLAHRVVVQNPDDLCLLQKICGLPAEKFQSNNQSKIPNIDSFVDNLQIWNNIFDYATVYNFPKNLSHELACKCQFYFINMYIFENIVQNDQLKSRQVLPDYLIEKVKNKYNFPITRIILQFPILGLQFIALSFISYFLYWVRSIANVFQL